MQVVMHTINTLLERLDPDFVQKLKKLRVSILGRKHGYLLADNNCHIPGIAIHFNQDGEEHTDAKSLHSGWDVSTSINVLLFSFTVSLNPRLLFHWGGSRSANFDYQPLM